jgi:hypothetical protein
MDQGCLFPDALAALKDLVCLSVFNSELFGNDADAHKAWSMGCLALDRVAQAQGVLDQVKDAWARRESA